MRPTFACAARRCDRRRHEHRAALRGQGRRASTLLPAARRVSDPPRRRAGGAWRSSRGQIANDFPKMAFGYTGITTDPTASRSPRADPGAPIVFHSNGTVQNPAGVFLADVDRRLSQQAVSVTGAGRIRVWKWTGSAWSERTHAALTASPTSAASRSSSSWSRRRSPGSASSASQRRTCVDPRDGGRTEPTVATTSRQESDRADAPPPYAPSSRRLDAST